MSLEGADTLEYEFRSGSAAYALPEARATFIRKTYAHLAYALLGFAVLEYALLNFPGHEVLVGYLTYEWWLALLLFIVVGWVADYWARSEASRGLQYVGLAVYVVAEAVIFCRCYTLRSSLRGPDAGPGSSARHRAALSGAHSRSLYDESRLLLSAQHHLYQWARSPRA